MAAFLPLSFPLSGLVHSPATPRHAKARVGNTSVGMSALEHCRKPALKQVAGVTLRLSPGELAGPGAARKGGMDVASEAATGGSSP